MLSGVHAEFRQKNEKTDENTSRLCYNKPINEGSTYEEGSFS